MRLRSLMTIAALLLVGCGGETTETSDREALKSPDQRAVSSVLHQYVDALANDQFEKACSLFTRRARAPWGSSCAAAYKRSFDTSYTPADAARFRVRSVEITGDRALAITANEDRTKTYFRRVDGRWLLDDDPDEG
jgi:hypothetical protein